jgi:tetratricopeptide (TPR) repeat protein
MGDWLGAATGVIKRLLGGGGSSATPIGNRNAAAAGGGAAAASGDGSRVAGGIQISAGKDGKFNFNQNIVQGDPETTQAVVTEAYKRIAEEAARRGAAEHRAEHAEMRLQESESDNAALRKSVEDALARAKGLAEHGNRQAADALEAARESGDTAGLKRMLRVEAERRGDTVREAATDYIEIQRELAAVCYLTGDIEGAERSLRDILRLLPDDLDATNRLGHVHQLRGELDAAESQYRRLLQISPEIPMVKAAAMGSLGLIAQTRGDLDEAERLHRESLEINRRLGRLEGQASDLGNLGMIARARGDLQEAERLLRESLEMNRKLGHLEGQASGLGNLGLIAQTGGDLAGARRLWTESRDLYARIGMPHMVDTLQGWLSGLPPEDAAGEAPGEPQSDE